MAMPPAAPLRNSQPAPATENAALPSAILYATSAVASLISPSPSRMETRRRGTPSRRAIALAATGSGRPTIAPSTKDWRQRRPTRRWATPATTRILARTSPTDSSVIGRRSVRRSRRLAKNAAEYSSGGRKMTRTRSGSSLASGRPGRTPSRAPPSTSTTGYGTLIARAVAENTVTEISRATRMTSTWSISGRREVDYAADLPLLRLPALLQQVDVPQPLAQREVGRGDGDVAPDRLRDVMGGARLLAEEAEDLRRPPLVHGEALVDQGGVPVELVAVAGQDAGDRHLAGRPQALHVHEQRARAPGAGLAGAPAERQRDHGVGGDVLDQVVAGQEVTGDRVEEDRVARRVARAVQHGEGAVPERQLAAVVQHVRDGRAAAPAAVGARHRGKRGDHVAADAVAEHQRLRE